MIVEHHLDGVDKFSNELHQQLNGSSGWLRDSFDKCAIILQDFIKSRFDNNNWPPNKPNKSSRRPLEGLRNVAASEIDQLPNGVEISPSKAPVASGRATIDQIVFWHQVGAGNLPVREIYAMPDEGTIQSLTDQLHNDIGHQL